MRMTALFLVAVLVLGDCSFAASSARIPASTQPRTREAQQAAKAKAEVQKRGVGENSRVKVTLRNKTEVKGYISKIDEDSFQVANRKNGTVETINYADAEKVRGPGMSTGAKIAIGVLGVGAIVAVILIVGSKVRVRLFN